MNERARQDFAEFAAARPGELFRLAYVLTGDQHAAEDLLQSALTRAAAHWGRIHTAPEAYVRRIMYREQVSWWRRRARRPETAMAQVPERPAAAPSTTVEARLSLHDALRALPAGKRAVLVLRVPGRPARGPGRRHPRLFGRHGPQPDAQGPHPVAVGPGRPRPDKHRGAVMNGKEELIARALREIAGAGRHPPGSAPMRSGAGAAASGG